MDAMYNVYLSSQVDAPDMTATDHREKREASMGDFRLKRAIGAARGEGVFFDLVNRGNVARASRKDGLVARGSERT